MVYLLLLAFINLVALSQSNYHNSDNSNSCVDSCSDGFNLNYKINLQDGIYDLKDKDLVEVLEEGFTEDDSSEMDCSKNVLLRIPFFKLVNGTIVRIELEYGDLARGTTFHIGNSPTNDLLGGDRNTTMFNSEIYSNETNLSYYMSSLNLCDHDIVQDESLDISRLLFLNESLSYINPKSKLIVYISEKWFRVDNLEKNTSFYYSSEYLFTFRKPELSEKCKKTDYNRSPYNKTSPFLYIGLNRVIADSKLSPGSGLCNANISFLNCYIDSQPAIDINVNEMKYNLVDTENIAWINPLSYLEPSVMEHASCSAQGVLKLRFDPKSDRKIARFDLGFGEELSGFTFNIGDSPSNNAYGGDSGTTSNSAEIHSNDNRFYVWLNTKYCGDTLLYKIEYNLFQSFDNLTIFISDQRIEITNYNGYHEILRNPYLYNLNSQNVTCNCFDTRCYAGVSPDDDVYFGINRVIGGTYRPGVGLCNAKISWLQCKNDVKSNTSLFESNYYQDLYSKSTTESVSEETITTSVELTTISSTVMVQEIETTVSDESLEDIDYESPSTTEYSTTLSLLELLKNSTTLIEKEKAEASGLITNVNEDDLEEVKTQPQQDNQHESQSEEKKEPEPEQEPETDLETETEVEENDEVSLETTGRMVKGTLGRFDKGRPLLIKHNITLINSTNEENTNAAEKVEEKREQDSLENLCNKENYKNGLTYHEFIDDSTKFVFCEAENKYSILTCPLNMKWSQSYQQCVQEM